MSDVEGDRSKDNVDNLDKEKLPKHLRLRYWTSWEEMRLVELWRQNTGEITTLTKNQPVFRKIADGMKSKGFHVNGQECRRKISSLKNKYLLNHRRIEAGDSSTGSEWRLHPLIHCVLEPMSDKFDVTHEMKIVTKFLDKLPAYSIETPAPTLPVSRSTSSNSKQTISSNRGTSNELHNQLHTDSAPTIEESHNKEKRVRRCTSAKDSAFNFLYRTLCTEAGVAQLRIENQRLSEELQQQAMQLELEQREYDFLENFMIRFQRKCEQTLMDVEV